MSVAELLTELHKNDIRIWCEGDKLRYRTASGRLPPELGQELAKRKTEILGFLQETVQADHAQNVIVPVGRGNDLPLSASEARLWFICQLEPDTPTYNMSQAFHLSGPLDEQVVENCVTHLVRRHEILRTTYTFKDGQPTRVIADVKPFRLSVTDSINRTYAENRDSTNRWREEEARHLFDLATGPLFRVSLLRFSAQEYVLVMTMHHIISDGVSMGILWRELGALYEAILQDQPSPLPDLPIQYADFACWQRSRQDETVSTQLAYWTSQLQDAPPLLLLPTDYQRPAQQTYHGESVSLSLPPDLLRILQSLSQREEVTLFMTLLAAFKVLFFRYTGEESIVIGAPIAGRTQVETENLIGCFLNNLVLHTDLSGNPTFREFLIRVREVALGAYSHQEIPFEKLLEELHVERDMSYSPLFQVFFNMLDLDGQEFELPGVTAEPIELLEVHSMFDLTFYVRRRGDQLHLRLVYRIDLFKKERMVELLNQYVNLLHQLAGDPGRPLCEYSLATPQAKRVLPDPTKRLSAAWAGSVHDQVRIHSEQWPDHHAIIEPVGQWTYRQLEQRSNQLAHFLLANDIRPGDIVAVYGHRSAGIVWAWLGILKAGAAFVTLDPAYPAQRLRYYLDSTQAKGLLQIDGAGPLPSELVHYTDRLRCHLTLPQHAQLGTPSELKTHAITAPEIDVGPDHLAYIAFTSGSTDKPKGVVGRHGPLSHFLPWQTTEFDIRASDRFSMLSGLSHDPLQREIFTAWWVGGTICIPEPDFIGVPGALAKWMQQEQVTFAHLTPAMGQILTETTQAGITLPHLRYAHFVGDELTRVYVDRLRRLATNMTAINTYGSTETQRAVSYHIVPPAPLEASLVQEKAILPLGRGVPDAQLIVLNGDQQQTGIGELGEIHMRSPHLAAGYLGDETLTNARFFLNPYTSIGLDRIYRTGDYGRYQSDGTVEFAGRVDHQAKIRGFRVEPGEIEAVLGQHPAIRSSVVAVRASASGEAYLVAWWTARNGDSVSETDLRVFLRRQLPEHMIPSVFVPLETLPITPNGKVDRNRLPNPNSNAKSSLSKAPETALERQLLSIWQQILGTRNLGVDDNFFDKGGHSLLAVRLTAEVEKATGKNLPVASLFQGPSVREQAALLALGDWTSPWPSLAPVQPGGSRPTLFLVPPAASTSMRFSQLAEHLGPDQPIYGFDPKGVDGLSRPHTSIEEMAAQYVSDLRQFQPHGPYLLGGMCMGGHVAYEMAQQLNQQGHAVPVLLLLDIGHPANGPSWSLAPRNSLYYWRRMKYYYHEGNPLVAVSRSLSGRLRRYSRQIIHWRNPEIHRIAAVFSVHLQAMRNYRAERGETKLILFQSDDPLINHRQRRWAELTSDLEIIRFPSLSHDSLLLKDENVGLIAEALKDAIDMWIAEFWSEGAPNASQRFPQR